MPEPLNDHQQELIDTALRLDAEGFPIVIIPAKGGRFDGKQPLDSAWQSKRLTPEQIRARIESRPDVAGIGIVSGNRFGQNLIVLDFDGAYWDVVFGIWAEEFQDIAETRSLQSGSGKMHVHIRCLDIPDDFTCKKFRHSDEAIVELRGNGSQTLVPPSIHPSGGSYAWVDEDAPILECSFERLRAWLSEWAGESVSDTDTPVQTTEAGLPITRRTQTFISRGAPIGMQRSAALAAARNLLSNGKSVKEIADALYAGFNAGPQDKSKPWLYADATSIAKSIAKSPHRPAPLYPEEVELQLGSSAGVNGMVTPPADADDIFDEIHFPSWPYGIIKDKMVFFTIGGAGDTRKGTPHDICHFHAHITTEAQTEDGRSLWTIEGNTVTGKREFIVEVDSKIFTDARQLKAALSAGVGPLSPILAKMEGHLGPAIQNLTRIHPTPILLIRQYDRTGWMDLCRNRFLIPGYREDKKYRIRVPACLPYYLSDDASIKDGLRGLEALLLCKPATFTLVLLASILTAPAARLMGLDNDRYLTFINGETGSYKTSVTSTAMTIYGMGFGSDVNLMKWGEGATSNALLNLATYTTDLPFLIDNYKPNAGGGAKAFVGLSQNMLEGGERLRLNRNSEMRATREIHTWPICTGEDVPSHDAATLARMLILPAHRSDTDLVQLTLAQSKIPSMPAIGREWLVWLESPQGAARAQEIGERLVERRTYWMKQMLRLRPDCQPHGRIASNLAVNELTGLLIASCPFLAPLWNQVNCLEEHHGGLMEIASSMASGTADSSEASRFLSILSEMLVSGAAVCAPKNTSLTGYFAPGTSNADPNPDRLIGWKDADGYYLLPELARKLITKINPTALNEISATGLYRQLDGLGALAGREKERATVNIRVNANETARVLWIKKSFLEVDA